MIASLLTLALAWVAFAALGVLVLGRAEPRVRDLVLPAAPLVGVALVVAVLHWTTVLVSVRVGVLALGAVVAALLALDRRSGWSAWRLPRAPVVALTVAALVGVPAAGLALAPSLANDGAMVQPTTNHDSYYYTAAAEWLQDSRGTEPPNIGTDPTLGDSPPAYGPAVAQITLHVRLGESLTQAAVAVVSGQDGSRVFWPMVALWSLLVVSSVTAAMRLTRLPTSAGVVVGGVTSVHVLVVYQAHNQNSASLLGLAFAPLALAALHRALDRGSGFPAWLAALLLVGWLGSYTEYAAIGVPAVLVVLLARAPASWWPALRSGLVVAALALVMAPLVWINGVRSLLFLGGMPEGPRATPYTDVAFGTLLNRLTGASTIDEGLLESRLAPWLALSVAVGLLLVAVLGRYRGLWLGTALGVVVAVARFSVGDPRPYTQARVIEIGLPLLLVAAGVGWTAAVVALRPRALLAARSAAVVGLAVATVWAFVNVRSDVRVTDQNLDRARPVDADFAEAAEWVEELGGQDGEDVTVVTGDFWQQLWLTYALREAEQVSYAALTTDYLRVPVHWAGESDPLVLVDDETFVDADPDVEVRANGRFRLLDLRRGAAVVASSTPAAGLPWLGERPQTWTAVDGDFVVLCSAGRPCTVRLEVQAVDASSPVRFAVRQDGQVLASGAALPDRPSTVSVDLAGDATAGALVLDVDEQPTDGAAPAPSVRLLDVSRGG